MAFAQVSIRPTGDRTGSGGGIVTMQPIMSMGVAPSLSQPRAPLPVYSTQPSVPAGTSTGAAPVLGTQGGYTYTTPRDTTLQPVSSRAPGSTAYQPTTPSTGDTGVRAPFTTPRTDIPSAPQESLRTVTEVVQTTVPQPSEPSYVSTSEPYTTPYEEVPAEIPSTGFSLASMFGNINPMWLLAGAGILLFALSQQKKRRKPRRKRR